MSRVRWIAALMGLSVFTDPAFALDILGKGNWYIKVTPQDEYRTFELCHKKQPLEECRLLGERSYRYSELVNLHDKFVSIGVGTSMITLAAIYPAYMAIGLGLVEIAAGKAIGLYLVAGPGGAAALAATSKYAPWNLFKRAHLIRDEVIDDSDVSFTGTDEEMKDVARALDGVLKELK